MVSKSLIMRYLLIIICVVFAFSGQAQNELPSEPAKVYLNNGSILKGDIKEFTAEGDLVLLIRSSELKIPQDQIKKIVMLASSRKVDFRKIKTGKVYHRTNLGLLSNANGNGISLNYSALYLHKYWLGVGAGVGIDNYYFAEGRNVFPVFTEIKSFLVDKRSAPYVSIKTGYGFMVPDEDLGQRKTKGGFIFNPTFGYRFGTNSLMFDTYIGLRFQKAQYNTFDGWETRNQNISWNRVETGIAISF